MRLDTDLSGSVDRLVVGSDDAQVELPLPSVPGAVLGLGRLGRGRGEW